MKTLEELTLTLNNTGMLQSLNALQKFIVMSAAKAVLGPQAFKDDQTPQQDARFLLNSVGPAAATAAVDYATNACINQGLIRSTASLTTNQLNNFQIICNDEGFPAFANVLRQFLIPRYAYLDFDMVIDPRHMIDEECGYPKFITPIMYRYLYDRDDVARRVNDIYPDETWAADPKIYEDEDEDVETPFEKEWKRLCTEMQLLQMLYRVDKLSGIGHYGILLLGLDDGQDLETPVAGIKNTGELDPNFKGQHKLMYMRPFDEYLSFILQFETDINNPRYGQPVLYNLVFLDMTIDAAGASIGTRLNRRVHWTRVIHISDNMQSSLVFGTPRMQPVFNRLLDLRKIKGGSAEMFWKGAFPGISFEIDPNVVADNVNFDPEAFKKEVESYANGLQRYMTTLGVKANSLAPQVADPEKHVMMQVQAISMHYGVPIRIFMGSEEGRLASSQDKVTWNSRLGRRLKMHVEPLLIRKVIDRFIMLGILPKPKEYFVDWSDLNIVSDEDRANLSLKWTQALSQYVSSGVIHLIPPMDYFTLILGMKPGDAKRIIAKVEAEGGFEKLKKVDPSQGSGQNGVRTNDVGDTGSNSDSRSKPVKRNTADKQAEGKSS